MGKIEVVKIAWSDSTKLREAARTLCAAFSNDPLIHWLRPGARPWAELRSESLKWQQRRIQQAALDGYVIGLKSCRSNDTESTSVVEVSTDKSMLRKTPATSVSPVRGSTELDAVAIFYPPEMSFTRAIWRPFLQLHLAVRDWFYPVEDDARADRVDLMMQKHHERKQSLHKRYSKLWYIEVIAVNPLAQGQGLGKRIMQIVDKQIGQSPIMLECTDKANIRFYEKFGFNVILEEELRSGDSATTLWIMVRQ